MNTNDFEPNRKPSQHYIEEYDRAAIKELISPITQEIPEGLTIRIREV